MKTRYTIAMLIEDIGTMFQGRPDVSPTTLRCVMNDQLDGMEKDGFRVNFRFNQARAVKMALKRIRHEK